MKKIVFVLLLFLMVLSGCGLFESENDAPEHPSSPIPSDGSINVNVYTELLWICSDPEGNELSYDVYFGPLSVPSLVNSNQTYENYSMGLLQYGTTYFWKIVANNGYNETSSPVWRFTTVATNTDEMIYIEGGTFNNGVSNVFVSSFYIGPHEIMQSEYKALMGTNPSNHTSVANGPVDLVSWFDAIEYCNRRSIDESLTSCYSYNNYGGNPNNWPEGWNTNSDNHVFVSCSWAANGYRLLTEAEWEYAARGGNQTHNYTYSGSDDIYLVAWFEYNSGMSTHSVGTKTANELGLFDMSGNVHELLWDIEGGYPSNPQTDPHGAAFGNYRVIRGGSYNSVFACKTSFRNYIDASNHNGGTGFWISRAFD